MQVLSDLPEMAHENPNVCLSKAHGSMGDTDNILSSHAVSMLRRLPHFWGRSRTRGTAGQRRRRSSCRRLLLALFLSLQTSNETVEVKDQASRPPTVHTTNWKLQ